MENLEDILKLVFSLVFGAIYLFGSQIFKGNKEDNSQRPENSRKTGEDDQEVDEQEARQREIREAIRRKILERRSKKDESVPAFEEPLAQSQEHLSEDSRTFKGMESSAADASEPVQKTAKADESFSWDVSDNIYEKQMQERLQQIEVTKRKAEVLKQKVGKINLPSVEIDSSEKTILKGLPSGSVRSTLRGPRVARAAFVYSEVLGKPLSLRRSTGSLTGE